MSWLNISGNLSSLANNVTTFTREVLTEVKDESVHRYSDNDDDDDDEDFDGSNQYSSKQNNYDNNYYVDSEQTSQQHSLVHDKILQLQDELNLLNTELSSKDDQIYLLEQENTKIQRDYHKHMENLKTHLLEKEKEVEEIGTKLNESEDEHESIIKELLEKQQRELEFAKTLGEVNKDDDSWSDDWGGRSEDVENLKSMNDSLSNEVMMKEIILNSIEEKMSSLSGQHIDVADFTTWCDQFVSQQPISENAGVLNVLKAGLQKSGKKYDAENPAHVEEWLSVITKQNLTLREKIDDMEKVIASVETTMTDHSNEAFTIEEFEDWLKTISTTNTIQRTIETTQDVDTSTAEKLLKQIEIEIRELDEEYENFEISNFSSWLETIQAKIDDLEVEMLNEQESRDAEEQQRVLERAKLEDLFNEKQNEIALLKVELYNKEARVHHPADDSIDNQTISQLHEQLSEAHARCQGLQEELQCVQKRNVDLSDSQEELSDVINQHEISQTEMQKVIEEKQYLQNELIAAQKKFELLERELSTEQEDNNKVQEDLTNFKLSNEQLENQLTEYVNAYNTLQQQCYEQQTTYQTLHSQYEDLLQNYNTLHSEHQNLQSQYDDMSSHFEDMKNQIPIISQSINEETQDREINELVEKLNLVNIIVNKINAGEGIDELLIEKINNTDPSGIFTNLKELSSSYIAICQIEKVLQSKIEELGDVITQQSQELTNVKFQSSNLHECLLYVTKNLDEMEFVETSEKLFIDGNLHSDDPTVYKQYLNSFKINIKNLQNEKQNLLLQIEKLSNKQKTVSNDIPRKQQNISKPSVQKKKNILSQYFGGADDSSDPFGSGGNDTSDPFGSGNDTEDLYAGNSNLGSNTSLQSNSPTAPIVEFNGHSKQTSQELLDKENMIHNLQHELDMKNNELAHINERVTTLESQCNNLLQELQNQMQNVELLTQQLDQSKSLLDQYSTEKLNIENFNTEISQQVIVKENFIQELNQHLVQRNEMIKELSTEKESLQNKYAENLEHFEHQGQELYNLKQNLEEQSKLSEEFQHEAMSSNQQSQEICQLKQELDKYNKLFAQKDNETVELMNQLRQQIEESVKLAEEYNNEKTLHEHNIKELQDEIMDLQNVVSDLRRAQSTSPSDGGGSGGMKFGVLKKKLKELEERNESLQNELKQKQGSSNESSNVIILESILLEVSKVLDSFHLNTDQKTLVNNNSLTTYEPSIYHSYMQTLSSVFNELTTERDSLKFSLEAIAKKNQATNKDYTQDVPLLQEEVVEICDVENVQELNTGNTDEWESWGTNFEEFTERKPSVIEMNSDNNADSMEHVNSKIATLERNIEEERVVKLSYEKEIGELKTSIENLETKFKNESKMVKKLRAKLQVSEKRKVKEGNAVEVSELKSNVTRLEDTIQNLQNDLSGLREKLNDSENLIDEGRLEKVSYMGEIDELKENIALLEKSSGDLQRTLPQANEMPSSEGSSMKFGTMKRKLQELEAVNSSLQKDNEQLQNKENNGYQLNELSKQLNEKTSECQYYYDESERLKSTLLGLQNDMQTIQDECYRLKVMLHDQQNTPSQEQQPYFPYSQDQNLTISAQQQQDQLHNLSLKLTDKSEECEHLQHQCEYLNAKVLELQNDTSDLELIREECKQLKTMLVGKEHESRVDETISMLQTEGKQLKHLLIQKDTEYQQLQNALLEKENDVSDMELLRDECKQLKKMLIAQGSPTASQSNLMEESFHQLEASLLEKDQDILHKDAMIIEMQNSNSDMELLREECKQLKVMLMAKTPSLENNTASESTNELTQIKELLQLREENLKEKELAMSKMHDSLMEMEILRNETEQLKEMLQQKHQQSAPADTSINVSSMNTTDAFSENSFFMQVQQLEDLITAKDLEIKEKLEEIQEKDNLIQQKDLEIQQKDYMILEMQNQTSDLELLHNECRALKEMIVEKEQMFGELQNDLDSANDALQQKNDELKTKTNELNNTALENSQLQEELTQSMGQDENIHLLQTEYRNVEEQYKAMEKQFKECREKLFTAETHIERLKVYEEQFGQLKSVLKEKEEALNALQLQSSESSILDSETVNILHKEQNELKALVYERETRMMELSSTLEKKNIEIQNIYNESREFANTLQNQLQSRDQHIEYLNSEKESLEQLSTSRHEDSIQFKAEIEHLKEVYSNHEEKESSMNMRIKELQEQLANQNIAFSNLKNQLKTYRVDFTEKKEEIEEDSSSKQPLTIDNYDEAVNMNRIKKLEPEFDESLVTALKHQQTPCVKCSQNHELQTTAVQLLSEIKAGLHIPEDAVESTILTDLHAIHFSIDQLISTNSKLTANVQHLQFLNNELNEKLQNQVIDQDSSFAKTTEDYEFKIKDLQSQLLEYHELDVDYQNIRTEKQHLDDQYDKLQNLNEEIAHQLTEEQKKRRKESELAAEQVVLLEEQFNNLQDEYQKRIKESETTSNSVVVAECERLREKLEENSHSYLNKTKECDQLKLDILQLEEKSYNYEIEHEKMQKWEGKIQNISQLENENHTLKSTLEDYQEKIESGKKEKTFLEEVVHQKANLDQEKSQLFFQLNQATVRVQEQDVLLKHKDIQYREVEAKSTRELERLRNHLIMIEENHEKDIMDLKDREQALQQQLDDSKQILSKKSLILQDSSKQFQDHVGNLEEQLHILASQRDTQTLELSKCKDKIEYDAQAIYNLQSALEQLEKDKTEQYDFLMSVAKRKEAELEQKIEKLTEEQIQAQATMSDASLAVQGIQKITLELQQKDNELKVYKEKINELLVVLKERETQVGKMMEASDGKLDKSLIRNLLLKYFQSEENKRADIVQVIGGLLGIPQDEILQIGSGAVPSKVGGWISNVWGYTTPKKPPVPLTPARKVDVNQSFSELFVKFLEQGSEKQQEIVNTTSLTINNDVPTTSNFKMFTPSATPDILTFHNNRNDSLNTSQTIPAPGQEIPRVHTHHAQSTLKNLLA